MKEKSTPIDAAAKRLLEASIRQINSIDPNTDSDSLTLAEGVKGIRQAFAALEASSSHSTKADVEAFVHELESSNRACLKATAYGHGPPAEWMVSLMAEYDRWKYEYNKELIQRLKK